VLADDGRQSKPVDGDGRREARRRATVERRGRVVDRAVRQTVHRTPSSLAEDVVTQALHGVGRQLLMRDGKTQQSRTRQSRYTVTCSLPSSSSSALSPVIIIYLLGTVIKYSTCQLDTRWTEMSSL